MTDVAAKIVWKLARRHSWGAPIPPDQLVRLVAGPEDHDEVTQTLDRKVLEFAFVARSPEGIYIPNGRDPHVTAADWLLAHTELDEISIATTLSRLPETWPQKPITLLVIEALWELPPTPQAAAGPAPQVLPRPPR